MNEETIELVRSRLESVCRSLSDGLDLDEEFTGRLDGLTTGSNVVSAPLPDARQARAGGGMGDISTTYMGTMMTHTFGSVVLTSVFVGVNPVGWAVAAGFGVAWAVRAAQGRAHAADRAALEAWAAGTLNDCSGSIDRECNKRIDMVLRLLLKNLKTVLPQHLNRMEEELTELKGAQARSDEDRRLAIAKLDDQLDKIRILARAADVRLRKIRAELPVGDRSQTSEALPPNPELTEPAGIWRRTSG